jgi:hypothetical protein
MDGENLYNRIGKSKLEMRLLGAEKAQGIEDRDMYV